jgi:hypothetical protein
MINKSGFFRWRNILDQPGHSRVEPKRAPSFVPLRVMPEAVVEVILPSGIQLRVLLGADAVQVARLGHALGPAHADPRPGRSPARGRAI